MLADNLYNGRFPGRLWNRSDGSARFAALRAAFLGRVDTSALVAATQSFTISRVLLIVTTYLAMALHPSVWGHGHPSSPTFWDAWYQWDGRWYVRVARSGYHWQDFQHWSSVAFFPLYPALILALVTVLPISTKLVAMIIANLAFFAALYALHRLVRREFDEQIAGRALLYLALFPTALFFFAGYSESLFLLFSVLSITAMRDRRWFLAGLWGLVAAATRSQGLVLVVPFIVECWQTYGSHRRALLQSLWAGLIPMGWGIFAVVLRIRFDNALLFLQIQRAWHRTTSWPWMGIWLSLQRLPMNHIASERPAHNLIELASVTLVMTLIVLGWKVLPHSFSLYAVASLLLVLMSPASLDHYYLPLMSSSRLCLTIFPCFIVLAIRGANPHIDRAVTTLGPGLLAIFTVIFLQGGWVA